MLLVSDFKTGFWISLICFQILYLVRFFSFHICICDWTLGLERSFFIDHVFFLKSIVWGIIKINAAIAIIFFCFGCLFVCLLVLSGFLPTSRYFLLQHSVYCLSFTPVVSFSFFSLFSFTLSFVRSLYLFILFFICLGFFLPVSYLFHIIYFFFLIYQDSFITLVLSFLC